MSKIGFESIIKWMLLCVWSLLFIGGVTYYPGSWVTYTVFSLVFLSMLISSVYRQISYGYFFLVVMLWLGFWFKVTVHTLVEYPFGELVGFFEGKPAAWDEVLQVATVGSVGVMVARLLYGMVTKPPVLITQNNIFKPPSWYPGVRKWMWAGAVFVCVGLAIINAVLGILQIGLVPRTILMWPLNAVISWLIGYGLTFGVATLLWWDIALGRRVSITVYFILIEAFASTVSLMSRGAYIFHSVPQFLALYRNRELLIGWSRKKTISLAGVFIVLFAISAPLVNSIRYYYYEDVDFSWKDNAVALWNGSSSGLNGGLHLGSSGSLGGSLSGLVRFSVDRWIGVEGVMAVSAYPNKSGEMFVRGLTERDAIGKVTIYQDVCKLSYKSVDMTKYKFASLPGAVAFLYYTGYLWVVALGMFVLVLAVLGSEGVVLKLTSNPILSALWGGAAANAVAQLGGAPRGLLFYFFEMSCGILAIWFIQSKWFSKILKKLGIVESSSAEAERAA